MRDFLNEYILVWQLPVALLIASLAVICIRTAYRKARIGDIDMLDHGAVEQTFMSSLWVGIAAIVYPYAIALIIGVWVAFIHRHLMSMRAWMASLLAISLSGFWYYIIHYHL